MLLWHKKKLKTYVNKQALRSSCELLRQGIRDLYETTRNCRKILSMSRNCMQAQEAKWNWNGINVVAPQRDPCHHSRGRNFRPRRQHASHLIFFKLALFIISHRLCFNRPSQVRVTVSAGPLSWVDWEGGSFVAPQSSLCPLITRVGGLQAGYWHAASPPQPGTSDHTCHTWHQGETWHRASANISYKLIINISVLYVQWQCPSPFLFLEDNILLEFQQALRFILI